MSDALKILIAEDEALIVMQLECLIEEAGHAVVGIAATAREAIGVAQATRPDLVFVDLQLRGGSSGLDLVRTLRGDAAMVLVFVTANAQHLPADFEGADGVIAKPFSEAVVFDTMAYFADRLRGRPGTAPVPLGLRLAPDQR